MKTKCFVLLAGICFAAASLARAATNDLSTALQKGLFEEEANHNLDAAVTAYQAVATQFDKDRKLAATAIFRLGEVYRKQGKTNEADAQYERILRDFSDQAALADLSRKALPRVEVISKPGIPIVTDPGQRKEDEEIARIKAMIKDSPDLIKASDGALTPLKKAANMNWLRVAEFLLANGADVNRKSGNDTPLHLAVGHGFKSMVELLVAHGADLETKDGTGAAALHIASQSGLKAIAEILLANKADVNARNIPANGENTPLHAAAAAGYKAVAEVLLANGANVNATNKAGRTPLFSAIPLKNFAMVKFLVESKADVNAKDMDEETPLSVAVSQGNLELAKFLIANKADVNSVSANSKTPLFAAVSWNPPKPKLVELLLQNGANPDAKYFFGDYKGWTALHFAAFQMKKEIAELLLKSGANPNSTNDFGQIPLHWAASMGAAEIAELLLMHHADVNAKTTSGDTPLLYAIRSWRKPVIELLLLLKADPNLANNLGETPFGYVKNPLPRTSNMPSKAILEEIEQLLIKYGANENAERLTRISAGRNQNSAQPIYPKINGPVNRYNLFEMLIAFNFPFPDFANIKIHRLYPKAQQTNVIEANLKEALKTGDCSKNVWLEWGDIVVIPELDHPISQHWYGYYPESAKALQKCLERKVSITIKGATTNVTLSATIDKSIGRADSWRVTADFWLDLVLQPFLRASSDRTRIQVHRIDPVTKAPVEITQNLENSDGSFRVWLLDGDKIEIPERDPNAPATPESQPILNRAIRAVPVQK